MKITLSIDFTKQNRRGASKKAPSFFTFLDHRILALEQEGRYSSFRNSKALYKKLSEYQQGKDLFPRDIDLDYLYGFCSYLKDTVGNSHNTVVETMKLFASVYRAYRKTYPDITCSEDPFQSFRLSREASHRDFLSPEEIDALMSLQVRSAISRVALDAFFVECYTGLRISDIITLKWRHYSPHFITLTMRKTGHDISIPLTRRVEEIILSYRTLFSTDDQYILPLLHQKMETMTEIGISKAIASATTLINTNLKRLARRAGIQKNISSHIGRHSFATMLITNGASIFDVKELLGHNDIRVTHVYTHMVDERKRQAIALLDH